MEGEGEGGVEGRGSYGIILVVLVSWSSIPNRPCHAPRLCPSVHKAPNPYITFHHRQCTTLKKWVLSQSLPLPRNEIKGWGNCWVREKRGGEMKTQTLPEKGRRKNQMGQKNTYV